MIGKLEESKDVIKKLRHRLNISRVIHYLKEREKEEGGFSFVPALYPDIEDTYYATRTLQLLKAEIDRSKTTNYLKSISWTDVSFPKAVYMVLYLHLSADMGLPAPLVDLLKMDWSKFKNLDVQYYSNEIRKLLNQPLILLNSSSSFLFQSNESLQSLRKKVSVLLSHHIEFDKREIIRWVQACQNGDGGFGFYPQTTSYMENTYCALDILLKLNVTPMRVDTCREYILGCQTKSGGFGRAPISFPFIESTFHAVAGLLFLEEME